MRHLHLYCTNKRIKETRELINDILENKVMECMVFANKVQEKKTTNEPGNEFKSDNE